MSQQPKIQPLAYDAKSMRFLVLDFLIRNFHKYKHTRHVPDNPSEILALYEASLAPLVFIDENIRVQAIIWDSPSPFDTGHSLEQVLFHIMADKTVIRHIKAIISHGLNHYHELGAKVIVLSGDWYHTWWRWLQKNLPGILNVTESVKYDPETETLRASWDFVIPLIPYVKLVEKGFSEYELRKPTIKRHKQSFRGFRLGQNGIVRFVQTIQRAYRFWQYTASKWGATIQYFRQYNEASGNGVHQCQYCLRK